MAPRKAEAWREVVAPIEAKKAVSYDKATALFRKLRDLAEYQGRTADFRNRDNDAQKF